MADPIERRILLTGATGFVGRQIRRNLSSDLQLHCTSRLTNDFASRETWHAIDLRDPKACETIIAEVQPDILIHCAWTTEHGAFWHDPENVTWLNAGKALFDAFVRHGGKRIVACGTCAEYPGDSVLPRREDDDIDPEGVRFPYGRAKLALLYHLRQLDVSYAWARIFLAYGEGENPRRLVPSVLRAIGRNEPTECSSGTQIRDFLDVRDLGAAIALLATSDIEGVVNLGSGERTSIAEVVQTLGRITGRLDLVQLGALPDRTDEPRVLVPDITRQTEELGFHPRIHVDRGLTDAAKLWLASDQP